MNLFQEYQKMGAECLISTEKFREKCKKIEVIVWDWDGVFHDGKKDGEGKSTFSEIDMMGINMLRFGYYLLKKKQIKTYIVTGEKNITGGFIATREHFDGIYYKIKNKVNFLKHLQDNYEGIESEKILFIFDDILDLSLARRTGFRMLVKKQSTPLFRDYCKKNACVDYITSMEAYQHAIRECCDLILYAINLHEEVYKKREAFHPLYKAYITERNQRPTGFFTHGDDHKIYEKSYPC